MGQRVFGWETPEAIAERNVQEETDLHNHRHFDCHIGCTGTFILRDADGNAVIDLQRMFTLGVLGLLVVIPVAAAASFRLRRLIARMGVPIASALIAALTCVALVLSRLGLSLLDGEDSRAARELMEAQWALLVAALAFLAFMDNRATPPDGQHL